MRLRLRYLRPALIGLSAVFGMTAGAGAAAASDLGVFIAKPVLTMPKRYLAWRHEDEIRKSALDAFKGGCRPVVESAPGLDGLTADQREALAAGKPLPAGVKIADAGARDLVAAAVHRERNGYRLEMALVDLRTGKPRGTAARSTRYAGSLAKAAREASAELIPALPCPVWRGEAIVTARQIHESDDKRGKTTGTEDATLFIRVNGATSSVTGRYEIAVETKKCPSGDGNGKGNGSGGKCGSHRIKGVGIAHSGGSAAATISLKPDGEYRIVVADAVADVDMQTRTCPADGGACATRSFVARVVVPGAVAHGYTIPGADRLVGVKTVADSPSLKKTMSWTFTLQLD
jgi:hypothetical protein